MLKRIELVQGPQDSAVPLSEVKRHLRVDHDDEDVIIAAYLEAAIAHLDGLSGTLGMALAPQTWRAVFCEGSDIDCLPLGPVISREAPVTVDGETSVVFVAGYPERIPAPIATAIMLHVGTLYQNREQEADKWQPTRAYEALLAPWRRWT